MRSPDATRPRNVSKCAECWCTGVLVGLRGGLSSVPGWHGSGWRELGWVQEGDEELTRCGEPRNYSLWVRLRIDDFGPSLPVGGVGGLSPHLGYR